MSPTLYGLALLAGLLQPPAGELTLEGVVLAPDGTPAVGARCLLSSRADLPFFFRLQTEVFSDGVIGEGGRFQLPVPESWIRRASQSPLDLWIWREDLCLELVSYRVKDLPVGVPIKIRTGTPELEAITVLDEAGEPVPGARITPRQYGYSPVPDALAGELTLGTDERGVAIPSRWDPARVENLAVDTERLGRHTFGGGGDGFAGETLHLGPVGGLRLEVRGEAPPLPPDLALTVRTYRATAEREVVTGYGELELRLSPGEEARAWPVAAGSANPSLGLSHPLARMPRIRGAVIEAGETAVLPLEWVDGVPASGRVVDAETGEPVSGVRLWVSSYPLTFPVVSGDDGTFEFRALPGGLAIVQIDAPRPYVGRSVFSRRPAAVAELDAGAEGVLLGEIELSRMRGVRGRVVDEAGVPVAGAWVFGSQRQTMAGGLITSVPVAAVSDEDGSFRIGGALTGEEDLELAARLGTARTRDVASFPLDAEVELVLVDDLLLPLRGKVLDQSGVPVADAEVVVWQAGQDSPFRPEEEVRIDGSQPVTNESGEFGGSSCIDPARNYLFVILSPGTERTVTRWISGEELRERIELEVPRLVALRGRLLKQDGTPRSDVPLRVTFAYRPPVTATTDSGGRFVLDGVDPGGALVLAEVEGLGARGCWFEGSGERDWVLPDDEAPLSALPTVPSVRERSLALATELAVLGVEALADSPDSYELLNAMRCLAAVDPGAALDALERISLTDRWRDSVLAEITRRLAMDDTDEALAVAGAMDLGMSSVLARLEVADALGPEELDRRIEILGLTLAEARRIDSPAYRLVSLSRIAERLRELGEVEAAREIVEEGRGIADELPAEEWAGYARASFAEELAVYDLDAALALIAEMPEQSTRGRHYGNLALELADLSPEAAEEVYGRLQEWNRVRRTPGICFRMAPVDLERARRIADGIDSAPEAYGNMARSLAEVDVELARGMLEIAVELLTDPTSREGRPYTVSNDCVVAGSLLPMAAEIAPDRLRDYLWQAVALRWSSPSMATLPDPRWPALSTDAKLAFFVARYDRDLARLLVAPALRLFEERAEQLEARGRDWRPLFAALVEIDPEWAVELADELLPADARETMAYVLALEGEARRWYVMSEYLAMWIPGDEDL